MKKISGFTLAETLVAFGIISVLIGAALVTLKPFDKNIKYLYSATYHSLDKALYNSMTYWVNGSSNPRERNPFVESFVKNNVSTNVTESDGAEKLCRALTEYINPTGEGSCSSSRAITDKANDDEFADSKVMFTATNGTRYWITQRYPANGTRDDNDNNKLALKYFIIYADLNGTKKPNSVEYESGEGYTKDPDIFAFAALETGRVVPLGPPEVDSRYMTTRITYSDPTSNSDEVIYSEPSQEYVKSQAEAWGYNFNSNDGISHTQNDSEYMEEAPFSFNGYLRSKISHDSKIYSFLGNQTMDGYIHNKFDFTELHSSVDINTPNAGNNQEYGCVWRSDIECQVIIDSYVW